MTKAQREHEQWKLREEKRRSRKPFDWNGIEMQKAIRPWASIPMDTRNAIECMRDVLKWTEPKESEHLHLKW